MKLFIAPAIALFLVWTFSSCKSSSGPATFCDTACLKDSLKFYGDHPLKPYVFVTASKCHADTITWSYDGAETNRKVNINYLLENTVHINKNFIRCFIKDTAYAWVIFNDCATGRGYQLKLAFNKSGNLTTRSSGINGTDPRFSVADNLIAYTDRGNIYVEDMVNGKKAMMTFGKKLDIDYSHFHDILDSVNITDSRIWSKVKINGEWKELQKKITLE
jgi:hypothetical protein